MKNLGLIFVSLLFSVTTTIANAETLKVGSTPTGVPFTFLDTDTQKITGMMVDLVTAVGQNAGFDVDVQAVDWVSLIPALTAGRIDIISAAMSITDKRKEVVDFSDPVFPYGEGMVVRVDDNRVYTQALTQTAGGTIGVQQGTLSHLGLKDREGIGEVRVYENSADILRDLSLGRLQAGFVDRPIVSYRLYEGKFPDLKLANGYESQFSSPLGLAIAKGQPELMARINAAIAELQADGEIDALAAKWHIN